MRNDRVGSHYYCTFPTFWSSAGPKTTTHKQTNKSTSRRRSSLTGTILSCCKIVHAMTPSTLSKLPCVSRVSETCAFEPRPAGTSDCAAEHLAHLLLLHGASAATSRHAKRSAVCPAWRLSITPVDYTTFSVRRKSAGSPTFPKQGSPQNAQKHTHSHIRFPPCTPGFNSRRESSLLFFR